MTAKFKIFSGLFLLLLIMFSCTQKENTVLSGKVFGTDYSIKYYSETVDDFQPQIDSLFQIINQSMSTYKDDSDISKLNRNEPVTVDAHFITVFEASKTIHRLTNGAFDPTIGNIVNAWDFGPEGNIANLDSLKIDSLMTYVGFDKVIRNENTIIKQFPETFIDFNAIAKGYGVDVIAEFLESRHIANYIVEIGGEIRANGINTETQQPWQVGVEMPQFDGSQSVLKAVPLTNGAMATSGTYRKFQIDEKGNRYSHIIDTKTGYPSTTSILSISVIAQNCMLADGYATAFKVMGVDAVKAFLNDHPELKVFVIFENDKGNVETLALNGFLSE